MKRILLDTNAYIDFLKGNGEILDAMSICESVYMSFFVLGELYYGFKKGSQETKNTSQLQSFLGKPSVTIVIPTTDTPVIFGEIKKGLSDKGKPIPTNDVWIAAQAKEIGAWLITLDQHFEHIPGLLLRTLPFEPNT